MKILATKFARENQIPFLGICLGLQAAVIDYARNVAGLVGANSTEFDSECDHPVIALIHEWTTVSGDKEVRDENSDLGGTMRLGAQKCLLEPGSIAQKCYCSSEIFERHRHRYEFNNNYLEVLSEAGLNFVGKSSDGMLVEVIEIPNHPWFVGVQFHPEYKSSVSNPHPLFIDFVKSSVMNYDTNTN